jgi:mannose-6-phosphate isomerase-like protein (cupin superfamily)
MSSASEQITAIPDDDPTRELTLARPDTDKSLLHLAVVGDTYTIVVSGTDTAGHYTLIDMHVPPGGGPPPHRHDFEEMFTMLDGEVELTFRGETIVARIGETVNIPANAPIWRGPGLSTVAVGSMACEGSGPNLYRRALVRRRMSGGGCCGGSFPDRGRLFDCQVHWELAASCLRSLGPWSFARW